MKLWTEVLAVLCYVVQELIETSEKESLMKYTQKWNSQYRWGGTVTVTIATLSEFKKCEKVFELSINV